MMDFEDFKKAVLQHFMDFVPNSIKNGQLQIFQIPKDDDMKDAMSVIVDNEEKDTWPMIYLDKMYENYLICGNLQGVLIEAGNFLEAGYQGIEKSYQMLDADNLRLNVEMDLVNTQLNPRLLENAPHKEFQDLSVIYRWSIASNPVYTIAPRVTNEIMEKMGVTEEELYQCAVENTKRKSKTKIVSLVEEMEGKHDMLDFGVDVTDKEAYLRKLIADAKANPQTAMWVLSNEKGQGGAIQFVYEENLRKIGEMMKTNIYIIPSSRHEVLIVSDEYSSVERLEDMLIGANQIVVDRKDFLSNNVYHYDRISREITMVTNNPVQQLDMSYPDIAEEGTVR